VQPGYCVATGPIIKRISIAEHGYLAHCGWLALDNLSREDRMVKVAPVTTIEVSVEEMLKHVARFKEQKSTAKSFIDTRIPGHERDIFSLIGQSTMEDPDVRPTIPAQEFHLSIIKAEPGKGAALHSHLTQEVFMPLTGQWSIFWGPNGDTEVILEPYDVISVPIHVMRGFKNAGRETALLLAVVGGHDPGKVGWPETMKQMARASGLELTDDGTFREVASAKQ
jgi:mannose-6-phosphate isomerase-like protein (cupin superfamily)